MRNILLIGHHDIRLFLRMKAGYVWLFLVPFAMVYFTGVGSRENAAPANPRPSVLVEDHDKGFLGAALRQALNAQGMNLVGPDKQHEAERGIRIPADLTERVLERQPTRVEFFRTEGSEAAAAALIELRLVGALIALNGYLLELALQTDAPQPISQAGLQAVMARSNPVSLRAKFAGRNPVPAGFNQSLPGTLVMFLLMNLTIFGGASVASERTHGVLRRLAAHPLRRSELALGKVYGRFLLGCVQIAFLLLAGKLVFRVNLGANLPGVFLTLAVYAWVAASLGVLLGSITRSPEKTVGLCVLTSMLMAALGGCWFPLELVSDTMRWIGHLFPTAWAMDALHQLISFGGGFSAVFPHLGMLAVFAIAANLAAAKWLRI